MRSSKEIRVELENINVRLMVLMGELSEALLKNNEGGYVEVMDSTYFLTTQENVRHYGDHGYEVGDWVPSSQTC